MNRNKMANYSHNSDIFWFYKKTGVTLKKVTMERRFQIFTTHSAYTLENLNKHVLT
jgi:hypothetical protein